MGSQQQVIAKPPYYPQHKQTLLTRVLRNTATASCSHSSALKTRVHSAQQFAALALPLLLRRKRQQRNFPQLAEPPPFPLPSCCRPTVAPQPRTAQRPPEGRSRGVARSGRRAELRCADCGACPPKAASSSVGLLSRAPLLAVHPSVRLCAYVAALRLPPARPPLTF